MEDDCRLWGACRPLCVRVRHFKKRDQLLVTNWITRIIEYLVSHLRCTLLDAYKQALCFVHTHVVFKACSMSGQSAVIYQPPTAGSASVTACSRSIVSVTLQGFTDWPACRLTSGEPSVDWANRLEQRDRCWCWFWINEWPCRLRMQAHQLWRRNMWAEPGASGGINTSSPWILLWWESAEI